MFEKMIAKVVQPKSISWNTPKFIEYETTDSEGKQLAEIKKGADVFLHKQIDLKPATSKEVYKKSESIWKQLLQHQLDKCLDNPDNRYGFSLDKETVVYLIDDYNNLIDVVLLCVTPYDEINCEAPKEIAEEIAQKLYNFMVKAGSYFCTRCKLDADISRLKDGSLPIHWVH